MNKLLPVRTPFAGQKPASDAEQLALLTEGPIAKQLTRDERILGVVLVSQLLLISDKLAAAGPIVGSSIT